MQTTTRALAFACRWFEPATVHRVFEPLIADWQREWNESQPAARPRVWLHGLSAFVCAALVSLPGVLATPAPRAITQRVAVRMTRFTLIVTTLLMIPPATAMWNAWANGASWMRGSLFVLAVPSAMILAFPFAMAGAVDAIRRHDAPAHIERSVALKLGAFAVLFMFIYSGWVVPAANQASRTAMNPAGMSAPLRVMGELTTAELVFDPARATVFERGTYLASRSISLQRELNHRAMLVVLPVVLLSLRWSAFNRARRRWYSPLPEWIAAPLTIGTMFGAAYLGNGIELAWGLPPGSRSWVPIAAFSLWGAMASLRRRVLERAVD